MSAPPISKSGPKLDPPKDDYNLFVGIFLWIGIGCLMPWNFFINATDYWMYKFRQLTPDNGTTDNLIGMEDGDDNKLSPLQLKWNSYLSISNMIPNLLVLFFNATCGHKFSLAPRLVIGQIIIIAIFAGTDAMTWVDTDEYQFDFLILTLISVVFISSMVGLVQGSQAALAALFPPKYMGLFMQGQAVGGIVVALLNIVTIAVGSDSVHSASWSFLIGTLFTVSSLILYIISTRLPFYKYYVHQSQPIGDSEREPLLSQSTVAGPEPETSTFQIVCKIWPWIVSIFTTFTVTLMMFPAIAVLVESTGKGTGSRWSDVYFTPVACFLVFNVGDYLGRALSTTVQWPKNPSQAEWPMMIASLVRIAFVPLILFCNAVPDNRVVSDVYIKSDAAYIIFMILFSVSNGYINSICLMHGPKTLERQIDQSRAASILVFYLMFGLTIGAILSTPLLHLI